MARSAAAAAAAAALLLLSVGAVAAFQPPPPPIPPPPFLVEALVGYAANKGLQMVAPGTGNAHNATGLRYVHLPVSLLPASFPRRAFVQVRDAAPVFNTLVDRISRDAYWLEASLGEAARSDDFTGRLLSMYMALHKEGPPAQPVALGLHRSDYMVDASSSSSSSGKEEEPRLLQVELNTIASSFGCLAAGTAGLHYYLISRYCRHGLSGPGQGRNLALDFLESYLAAHPGVVPPGAAPDEAMALEALRALPVNPTLEALPEAIAAAHEYYGQGRAAVVFVVQPGERNLFDQRFLELALWKSHGVPVVRLTLEQIHARCRLDPSKGNALLLDGKEEVSVVYFRAGYTPVDYPSEQAWAARLMVERSKAVKCPTLGYQLAGTKKVQQLLCDPAHLGRFLSSYEAADVSRHFTGMYSLGTEDLRPGSPSAAAVAEALAQPAGFVLKPQREGGGNNLYDDELAAALRTWAPERLAGHVLMQRIQAPQRPAFLVRDGEVASGPAISELGVFGTYLGDSSRDRQSVNDYAGYLVRTKLAHVNEGGVATGYAVLDSVMLHD